MAKTLITAKVGPDLDGVACIYAYEKYLNDPQKIGGVFGVSDPEAWYMIERLGIQDIRYNPAEDFEHVILVDASNLAGMPKQATHENVVEVIDHREQPTVEEDFPNAKIQNEMVGAAATLVAEKFYDKGEIDKNSATLLYGAIYSNTLNLKSTNTTDRDREAVRWLAEKIAMPENLVRQMFESKSTIIEKDLEKVLEADAKGLIMHGKKIDIIQIEVVGLKALVDSNKGRIISSLRKIKNNDKLDGIFLTAVDLEDSFNLFISEDEFVKGWLEEALGVKFDGDVARSDELILRKQIIPKLSNLDLN